MIARVKVVRPESSGTKLVSSRSGGGSDASSYAQRPYAPRSRQGSGAPSVPEQSWTQGAARMVQSLGEVLQRHRAEAQKESAIAQHSADAQHLSAALMGKEDLGDAISHIQSPDIQKEMLNIIEKQREYSQQRTDRQSDEKIKAGLNPITAAQTKLAQAEDARDGLSAAYAQEKDPDKKAQLQSLLDRSNETVNAYKDRIMSAEGKSPNLKQQFENQYLQNLAQNGPPGAAEQAAFKSSSNTPENALQKTIGAGIGKSINDQVSAMQAEAHTSSANKAQGEQVLQMLASDPNIQSGLGTEQWTKIKSGLSNIFPGMFEGLSDQQAFQKGVGNLLLQNIGKLRSQGVQRITESEIMNVIPAFTPTMLNSTQGIKQILELQNAIDPAIQKGNATLSGLLQKYQSDPNSIPNIQEAISDVKAATQKEVENASMGYMNAKMAGEGKKLVVNPDYDETKNPINKYITVPAEKPNAPAEQGQPQDQGMPMPPPAQNASQPTTQAPPQLPSQTQPQAKQPEHMQPQAQPPAQMPEQMPIQAQQQPQAPQQAPSPPVDPRAAQAIAQQAEGMSAQPTTNNVPMTQQPNQAMAMQLSNPNIPDSGQQIDPRKAALIQALMAAQNGQGGGQ